VSLGDTVRAWKGRNAQRAPRHDRARRTVERDGELVGAFDHVAETCDGQDGGVEGCCSPARGSGTESSRDSPLEGNCVDALRGSRAFLASETVMPVAGLCPACSRGRMAAGRDGLSASRGSHLDFALDAHALTSGLPRSSVRLTVRHLLRPAFRSVTCR
jgi:hypothetical protein